VTVGRDFDLLVEVQAGAQPVDSVSAYLNFDPAFLQVTRITPGASLPSILVNSFDNTAGQVNFSAGTSANFPSGTFTLVTVTFKALAPTASASLAFSTSATRVSDVSFGGSSVLKDVTDGTVVIAASNKLFLPLLPK